MPESIFKGPLRPLLLPDLLRHLAGSGRGGALVLTRGNEQVILYLGGDRLHDATSSRPEMRLSHRLMTEGALGGWAFDALRERLEPGSREGRELVEMGVLDPATLWARTAELVRDASREPFGWDRGEYLFLEGQEPDPGRFRHRLALADLVAEGLRGVRDRDLLRDFLPAGELVLEAESADRAGWQARLLPHEAYLRDLLDGSRTVAELAAISEIGEFETYRTLHLLLATGHARMALAGAVPAAAGEPREVRDVLRRYNDMFAALHQHLLREVGPIAAPILEKSLREVRALDPDLLEGVALEAEGTLDLFALERNLRRLPPERRLPVAVAGLNEFLYCGLLAIKRTLGRQHEAEAVRLLRTLRPVRQGLGA